MKPTYDEVAGALQLAIDMLLEQYRADRLDRIDEEHVEKLMKFNFFFDKETLLTAEYDGEGWFKEE
jgi:hypothetical protein